MDIYHLKGVRPYTVGRGSTCEVRILDMKMSRTHVRLEERDEGWLVVDLGSTNGALLDGSRISGEASLRPGCALAMGGTILEVVAITPHIDLDGDEIRSSALVDAAPTEAVSLPERQPLPEQPPLPDVTEDVPLPRPGIVTPELEPTADTADLMVATEPPESGTAAQAATVVATSSASSTSSRSSSRGLFITLLGRRVGPLPREQARELKARELRGTLTEADLDGLPVS
jgi:predicted component of type VI protein secretion system